MEVGLGARMGGRMLDKLVREVAVLMTDERSEFDVDAIVDASELRLDGGGGGARERSGAAGGIGLPDRRGES